VLKLDGQGCLLVKEDKYHENLSVIRIDGDVCGGGGDDISSILI
jgi:hypothetical protein